MKSNIILLSKLNTNIYVVVFRIIYRDIFNITTYFQIILKKIQSQQNCKSKIITKDHINKHCSG